MPVSLSAARAPAWDNQRLLQEGESPWLEHTVTTISPFVDRVVLAGAGEIPEQLPILNAYMIFPA